ncbi:hypothetical protein [Neptuniibacter sp. QD57_21]|uniref:hypothetical protein n=1 Tax=Neptuniibacter sp. QD57_21 TaxID=3398213 RepID=UPI0039F495ED
MSDPRLGTFTILLGEGDADDLLAAIQSFTVNPDGADEIVSMEFIEPPEVGDDGTLLVRIMGEEEGEISTLVVPAEYGIFTQGEDDQVYMFQGTWRDGSFTLNPPPGNSPKDPTYVLDGALGTFVYGIGTTLDQYNNYVDGLGENVTATYTGATGFGASVQLEIDFSNGGSWEGVFNGGADGALQFGPSGAVIGELGFTASGYIDETTLISDTISAGDLNVKIKGVDYERNIYGSVEATFYGSEAQGVGGSADITKEFYNKDGSSFDAKHVTTFAAERE